MTLLALGFYLGAAFVAFLVIEAPLWQRIVSAAIWFTFPFWKGR
jgi:hypothetical protein